MKKKYDLKLAVAKRFLRTFLPQAILVFPLVMKYATELKEVLPVWVLPVLVCAGSVITALDKLVREVRLRK